MVPALAKIGVLMTEETTKIIDPEIHAMNGVLSILQGIDPEGQKRVLSWACKKIGMDTPAGEIFSAGGNQGSESLERPRREGTIDTACARLSIKSCRDLLIASAAHITLFEGQERFSREEWVARAKESRNWKAKYVRQTSMGIVRLLNSGFVNETSRGVYAIPGNQLDELQAKFGN